MLTTWTALLINYFWPKETGNDLVQTWQVERCNNSVCLKWYYARLRSDRHGIVIWRNKFSKEWRIIISNLGYGYKDDPKLNHWVRLRSELGDWNIKFIKRANIWPWRRLFKLFKLLIKKFKFFGYFIVSFSKGLLNDFIFIFIFK